MMLGCNDLWHEFGDGSERECVLHGMTFDFPLKDAAEAHKALAGRKTTGKVLLIPG